jgi:hypothetical protein
MMNGLSFEDGASFVPVMARIVESHGAIFRTDGGGAILSSSAAVGFATTPSGCSPWVASKAFSASE